ncbi:Uncharacterized protein dnm_093890 [Desulfonema magnum]|uniref:Uncharacterized protein n=1 Tax=Desulfonema magnum TaxID=45655 RepID=A0A975BXT3_9BACT|nr:Uncharacterized protein dnm_093890 [Desulfonema magnum]
MPVFVSTPWFGGFIESRISNTLNRPVLIESIQWKWSEGILIKGIRIPDDPAFSDKPLLSAERITAEIRIKVIKEFCLIFNLFLDAMDIRVIRDKNGQTNVEKLLSQIRASEPKKKEKSQLSLAIPIDIQSKIYLNKISFLSEDRSTDRLLTLKDASIHLDMPSLYSRPIALNVSSDMKLDGRQVPRAHLKVFIKNIFDSRGKPDLTGIYVDTETELPGLRLAIRSDLKERTLKSQAEMNLKQLTEVLKPFMPRPISATEIAGNLKLVTSVSGDPRQSIFFDTALEGTGLGLSGALINDKSLGPVHFKISNKGNFDRASGKLSIRTGELDLLEKSRLSWSGHVSDLKNGIQDIHLKLAGSFSDLEEIFNKLQTVLRPPMSEAHISGNLKFEIHAFGNPGQLLSYDVNADGNDLRLSGGPVKDKRIGPVRFDISAKGKFDAQKGMLSVKSSRLDLLENCGFSWRGIAEKLNTPSPEIDLNLDSLKLDLGELLNTGKMFIPDTFPLRFTRASKKGITAHSPVLEVKNARFAGTIPSGPSSIRLSDLKLKIPECQFNSAKSALSATDLSLSISSINSVLTNFFPRQAELVASLSLNTLLIKGKKEISIKQLEIPGMTFNAEDIRKSEKGFLGLSSRFSIRESLRINRLNIPSVIDIKKGQHALKAKGRLRTDRGPELVLENLAVSAPLVTFGHPKHGTFKAGFDFNTAVSEMNFQGLRPLKLDISDLTSRIIINTPDNKNVLKMEISADAKDTALAFLNTKGKIAVNLTRLSENFLEKQSDLSSASPKDKMRLGGDAQLGWHISGRLPNDGELRKLKSMSSFDLEKDLPFLDKLNISYGMKDADAEFSLKKKHRLKIKSFSLSPPLKYAFDRKTGAGKLSANISIKRIEDIPFTKIKQPLGVDLSFLCQHDHLKAVTFSQTMETAPFIVKNKVDASVYGMDRILKQNFKMPLTLWLKYLGGTLRGNVSISDTSKLAIFTDTIKISGGLEFGTEAELSPSRNLRTKIWINASEMDIHKGNSFNIKGLGSALNLEKNYQIRTRGTGDKRKANRDRPAKTPLSAEVMTPDSAAASVSEAGNHLVQRFMDEMQNRFTTQHSLSFNSARIGSGSMPVKLGHAKLDLDLNKEMPAIDYFQIDLFGGTVIGSVSILQKADAFFLQARVTFSGLNTAEMFSGGDQEAGGEDTQVSGELSLFLPLFTKLKPLIRELKADIRLSHIGSRAIGQLLYSLDPYESNEAIISQRQLFQKGTPRWIRLTVRNGNLSLTGEVEVKGISLEIPRVDRLNIANLSGLDRFGTQITVFNPVIKALKIFSADVLTVDKNLKLEN